MAGLTKGPCMSINIGDLLGKLGGGSNQQQQPAAPSGGGGGGDLMASLLPMILPMLANGGLSKILGGLKSNGLMDQVDSWKGDGQNEPVSAAQIEQVMDDDTLNQVAEKAGVSKDQVASAISQVLPSLVDGAAHGKLPAQGAEAQPGQAQAAGGMDLGAMLGSISKQLGI